MIRSIILFFLSLPAYTDTHRPQEFLKSIHGAKNEGEQIYNHFCVNCHSPSPLIALGAPRIGEESDWKPRLKQGMSVLFKNTDEGLNAMPPRGGCFECTDKQLMLAITYMIQKQAHKTPHK